MTVVDAGLPAFRGQLDAALGGRRVDAVILTHGHPGTARARVELTLAPANVNGGH